MSKVGTHATCIFQDSDSYQKCIFHSTQIVKWNNSAIVLNSGGYKTLTTKRRMNQVSETYNLGFQVYQVDFIWYVDYRGETLEFKDYMKLER